MNTPIVLKPYVLTNEQKEKLIALCRKTFPEYGFTFSFGELEHLQIKIGTQLILINWFEFVVRMIIDLEDDPNSPFEQFFDKVRSCE